MRADKGSAAAIILLVAFAGCLGDSTGNETTTTPTGAGATTTAADGTTPNGTGPAGNQAPLIAVEVSANGTELASDNGTYYANVGVSLTFDATGSTDPEGAMLTVTWDFGDGNSSEGGQVTYAFGGVGNFTVTATATDPEGASDEASFAFSIQASGPAPGTMLREDKKTFTGTFTAGVQQGFPCIGNTAGSGHTYTHTWEIPATDSGATVMVSKWFLRITAGTTAVDTAMQFIGPDGKVLKDMDEGADNSETITLEDEYPSGKYQVKVFACAAVNAQYTVTGTATLLAV